VRAFRAVHAATPPRAAQGDITLIAGQTDGFGHNRAETANSRYDRVPHLQELTMAKDPFEQFGMPNEMRAFAEQSVAQAKQAFDGFIQAANQAMGQMKGHAAAAHTGATEIAHKSMGYAEQNVASSFEFAQKLMRAKDAAELMGLQSEYLSRQMHTLSTQVQDLGQTAAKMVMDAAKPKS
jgi:phasin